ncbi:MAG: hypothetical protein K6E92_06595 [Lachnospiraceae bacterium]|nr:hypothetical protein [Lachnospiraceae bacterium]
MPSAEIRREYIEDRQAPAGRVKFQTASLVCGIAAIGLVFTGIFQIPFAALSLLFASLGRKPGEAISSASRVGSILALIGGVGGLLLLAYSFYLLRTDPRILQQTEEMYRAIYGESSDFTAFMQFIQGAGVTN